MNQILDFGDGNNNNNNGKQPKKPIKEKKNKVEYNNNFGGNNFGGTNNGGIKTSMSDKVVKVFAILMIILAIALIISGTTSLMKNKKDAATKNSGTNVAPKIEAEILAELNNSNGKVKISVNSQVTISKMIYSWDQDHDNVVSGEKQTSIEEEVVAPYGEHVLHVQVTDEQNNKTTKDFTFNSATGMDTTQPKITLSVTENKKLLVSATDDTSIAYVTYTWNEEEVVTMTPEEEDLQEYEFEIDIPKGKNTIVVVAVDGSESSNAKTTSKVLEGVTKPEINCVFLDNTGAQLQITCTHENGIQKIYYTLNGQAYQWEAPEGEEAPKELSFIQDSFAGRNEMTITVTSVDGVTAEFNPQWDYGSEEEQQPENNEESDTGSAISEESTNN